jgi:hypothetical protein
MVKKARIAVAKRRQIPCLRSGAARDVRREPALFATARSFLLCYISNSRAEGETYFHRCTRPHFLGWLVKLVVYTRANRKTKAAKMADRLARMYGTEEDK